MKILPISDIHLEFGVDGEALCESLTEADVLVIAGDFHLARFLDQMRDALRPFVEKYSDVVYVPGNHEYYRSSPTEVGGVLRVLGQELQRLHILGPGLPVVIDGQKFIGGTMWFPDGPLNAMNARMLNDFRMIENFVPWVYNNNTAFREMLKQELDPDCIVVTHHLPSMRSVPPQWQGQIGNIFFVSDQERDISWRQPKLWIHGHTHSASDYKLGDTRVVCNPRGYPHEGHEQFNPNLIVEV